MGLWFKSGEEHHVFVNCEHIDHCRGGGIGIHSSVREEMFPEIKR